MRSFAENVDLCMVIEEGEPYLVEGALAAGIHVEGKPNDFRFGELNVNRVRRILEGDTSPEPKRVPGKAPSFCPGCPHRNSYTALKNLECIVPGDIGCYSMGAFAPFDTMDTLVCMGASIGVGLGLRHSLPPEQAKRVVSVIGDSTFVHSGITGLVEMVYNPPPTGHVVLILDNGITAMTGMQEHPGTGRNLEHARTGKVVFEDLARTLGIRNVHVIDPTAQFDEFQKLIQSCLEKPELSVVIARRDCLLAARSIREFERCNEQQAD
jgi:indolepyruvate ferredoxin oxidoreductase alpha subunit